MENTSSHPAMSSQLHEDPHKSRQDFDHKAEEHSQLTPGAVDIQRLRKSKKEQEQRLKLLRCRINHLTTQETSVWKDVAWTQQMALQAQEASCHRQVEQTEQARVQHHMNARDRALRKNTVETRSKILEKSNLTRLAKFEDKKSQGQQVREDSQRFQAALSLVRERTLQRKQTLVDAQRQKRRQQQMRRDQEIARQEQARQDMNMSKFAQMQEEMQSVEFALAEAEREELIALSRLQHSRSVHSDSVSHLHNIQGNSAEGSEVGEDSIEACQSARSGLDSMFDGGQLSVGSIYGSYLPTVEESPTRSQSLSPRSSPRHLTGSVSAPHLRMPLSARGMPRRPPGYY